MHNSSKHAGRVSRRLHTQITKTKHPRARTARTQTRTSAQAHQRTRVHTRTQIPTTYQTPPIHTPTTRSSIRPPAPSHVPRHIHRRPRTASLGLSAATSTRHPHARASSTARSPPAITASRPSLQRHIPRDVMRDATLSWRYHVAFHRDAAFFCRIPSGREVVHGREVTFGP